MEHFHSLVSSGFIISSFLVLTFFHSFCFSKNASNYGFVLEATKAPRVSFHDYIIVGGGTAGCPLAATLSRSGGVLLLERGGSPDGNPNVTEMALFGAALRDRSPKSPSQFFLTEEGVANARGRVLGGSSAINAGLYSRGEAEFVAEVGWDGKLVNKSFEWVEKRVAFVQTVKRWMSAVRDGLAEIGVVPYNGKTYEHLVGTKVAGSTFDDNGRRHTAANLLEYADPKGLTVLLHSTVQKILFATKGKSKPRAYGVEFKDASGKIHTAYLKPGSKNEIILSAGALGSPQLLMLSGVGPKQHLQEHKIKVVLDQPLVGQNMADNTMNAIIIPSTIPVEVSALQVVGITTSGFYIESISGINLGVPPNYLTLLGLPPPTNMTTRKPKNPLDQSSFTVGFFFEKLREPVSRGLLELRNVDPSDNPKVRFNYFKEPEDLQTCVRGIEKMKDLYKSNAFSKFRYANLSIETLLDFTANNKVNSSEQYCKDTLSTMWHYHGGCQVGSVVDHDYKVLGVDALRVIDGSTFHRAPGTNPQATVMMLGRYMGVKILRERLRSD